MKTEKDAIQESLSSEPVSSLGAALLLPNTGAWNAPQSLGDVFADPAAPVHSPPSGHPDFCHPPLTCTERGPLSRISHSGYNRRCALETVVVGSSVLAK